MPRRMSEERTEEIVARVLADPYTREHSTDGGAAAVQFIREAAAGEHNPAPGSPEWVARREAAAERWRSLLAAIQS